MNYYKLFTISYYYPPLESHGGERLRVGENNRSLNKSIFEIVLQLIPNSFIMLELTALLNSYRIYSTTNHVPLLLVRASGMQIFSLHANDGFSCGDSG